MHHQTATPCHKRHHICRCTPGKPARFPKAPAGLVALWWIWLFPIKEESFLGPHGLAALPSLQGIALDQAKSTCCPHGPPKEAAGLKLGLSR